MSTLHPPGSLKFERASATAERTQFQDSNVAWGNVLAGTAAKRFHDRFTPAFLRKAKA